MKAYFFPGLGADATLEPYHRIPGLEIEWVSWPAMIRPKWEDFLADLQDGNRFAPGGLFVGISFGGLVASRLSETVRPRGIILVGSLVDPKAIFPLLRIWKWALPALPSFIFDLTWVPGWIIAYFFGIKQKAHREHFSRMARGYSPGQTKNLIRLALSASPIANDVPVFAIHGKRDRIISFRRAQPHFLIETGGHLLSMTHSEEVNGRIAQWLGNPPSAAD